MNRREFLTTAAASAASFALPRMATTVDDPDLNPVWTEIEKRHDEAVQRLQEWIRQRSIAAENRGMGERCGLMMRMLRDAGFEHVNRMPTDEYYVIESSNPKVQGMAGATRSYVEYLYELAQI